MATETQEIIQREAPGIEAYKIGLMEQAKSLTSAPPVGGLPAIQSQGIDPLQTQAANLATQGVGSYQPFLTSAQSAFASGIGSLTGTQPQAQQMLAGSAMGYQPGMEQAFMNPYQQAVANEINRAYNIQQAQLGQKQAQAGAFGGSRAAIEQSELNRNRADALARAQAENFLQAQQAAMNTFEQQQQRQQRAGAGIGELGIGQAGALGQLGVQQAALGELGSNLGRADIQTLSTLGEQQRQIDQQALEAQRQTQLQQIYEPYQRLSFYSDILRGAPSSQQTLSVSSSPNPSVLNQVVGAGVAGLGMYGAAKNTGLI